VDRKFANAAACRLSGFLTNLLMERMIMARWLLGLAPNKQNFSFILTITCIVGMLLLAFFKDADILTALPIVLGTYLGSRTTDKAIAVNMASKDLNCDTRAVINDLEFGPGSTRSRAVDNPDK